MAERDNGCLVLHLREITKIKRQIPDPGSSYPLGRQVSFPFGSLPFVLIQINSMTNEDRTFVLGFSTTLFLYLAICSLEHLVIIQILKIRKFINALVFIL